MSAIVVTLRTLSRVKFTDNSLEATISEKWNIYETEYLGNIQGATAAENNEHGKFSEFCQLFNNNNSNCKKIP